MCITESEYLVFSVQFSVMKIIRNELFGELFGIIRVQTQIIFYSQTDENISVTSILNNKKMIHKIH